MHSLGSNRTWLHALLDFLIRASTFYLHAGMFAVAAIIAIARYSHQAPAGLIVVTTAWSVALLLHGFMVWRKADSQTADTRQKRDGVLTTVFAATAVNMLVWVMWALATDAGQAASFHLTVLITLIASVVSGLILGKRMLYAHWMKEFLRDHPAYADQTKPKRNEDLSLPLQLDTDGELLDYLDESGHLHLENRRGQS